MQVFEIKDIKVKKGGKVLHLIANYSLQYFLLNKYEVIPEFNQLLK